jgi:hypothetical protein
MKTSFFSKILFYLLISGNLFWNSCIDKNVDLGNLSDEMSIGGSLAVPLLKESRLDIYKLLERYEPDNTNNVTIGTDDNNDIFIAYDTVFRYAANEINLNFDSFTEQMNLGISQLFAGTPIEKILPYLKTEITLTPDITAEETIPYQYSINDSINIGELKNKQKLKNINFLNTNIIITIKPSFEIKSTGVLALEIKIPGIDKALTVDVKPEKYEYIVNDENNKDFKVNAEGEFEFTFKVKGDNETKVNSSDDIACSIAFKSLDEKPKYIAYGWFNYDYKNTFRSGILGAKLHDYIPENTELLVEDPQFMFEVRTNLGIPLEFGLDTIQSELLNDESKCFNKSVSFKINPADEYGQTTTTVIDTINNAFLLQHGSKFSDFIRTDLESLKFSYHFASQDINIDTIDLETSPPQFISSDANIEVNGKLKIPFAFDAGSRLCYRDTIELNLETESLEDVSSLDLRFDYTNHLPIGFYVDLYLLDETYKNILGTDKVYQTITIKKAETYTSGPNKGVVDESKLSPGKFSLKFEKDTETSITKLKDAKYLLFDYRSVKTKEEEAIRLKANDYLSIKLGAVIDGKIIINNE